MLQHSLKPPQKTRVQKTRAGPPASAYVSICQHMSAYVSIRQSNTDPAKCASSFSHSLFFTDTHARTHTYPMLIRCRSKQICVRQNFYPSYYPSHNHSIKRILLIKPYNVLGIFEATFYGSISCFGWDVLQSSNISVNYSTNTTPNAIHLNAVVRLSYMNVTLYDARLWPLLE